MLVSEVTASKNNAYQTHSQTLRTQPKREGDGRKTGAVLKALDYHIFLPAISLSLSLFISSPV